MRVKASTYKKNRVVYRTIGQGPVVVLLHGFGEDGTIWKNQYDLFPNHELLIPDLPGTGDSEMIEDMSMEGMADWLKNMLDGIFRDTFPITLIGHSMGGYVALAFAEKYPEALNALGLFHSTAFADSDAKKQARHTGMQAMKEKGSYEFLKEATPNLYAASTKESRAQLIDEHVATVHNANAEALVSYYQAMMNRRERTAVLTNSEVPVLFVLGKNDTVVPLEDGLKLCHLPQLSYIHVLQNSGHMGMVEEVEESNKILIAFVTMVENIAYT